MTHQSILQRCQPLEISNLEIFICLPLPLPLLNPTNLTAPPPPKKILQVHFPSPPSPSDISLQGKLGLSVRDFNWLNTHPITLLHNIIVIKRRLGCIKSFLFCYFVCSFEMLQFLFTILNTSCMTKLILCR